MPPVLTPQHPGSGSGWDQLVPAIAQALGQGDVDGIWIFRVVRSGGRDFGTAVISQVDGDRRRIYTARFVLTVKGKKRGAFESELIELGSGPLEAREELLALVPRRAELDDPLVPVPVSQWFPPVGEDAAGPE
jgi:hypothetical protein